MSTVADPSSPQADADRIVGTWRLLATEYEDAVTGERVGGLGAQPRGRQIATREGHWIAVVTPSGRSVPRSEAERSAAFQSMIAYTGRYRIEDGCVVTKVEAAWNEGWVGTEQVRRFHFDGNDTLRLESPPQRHPNLQDRMVRIVVTWARDS